MNRRNALKTAVGFFVGLVMPWKKAQSLFPVDVLHHSRVWIITEYDNEGNVTGVYYLPLRSSEETLGEAIARADCCRPPSGLGTFCMRSMCTLRKIMVK